MDRKVYCCDEFISLSEYVDAEDDLDCYTCWQDKDTQEGYNHKMTETFEKFAGGPVNSRFIATIVRLSDSARVGSLFLSPENTPPDLAIMIFKSHRGNGYGTKAFSLGVKYCFEVLKLPHLFAGCYPHNNASLAMLEKCGFQPHAEGNQIEKHYLTGAELTQLDFIKYNPLIV